MPDVDEQIEWLKANGHYDYFMTALRSGNAISNKTSWLASVYALVIRRHKKDAQIYQKLQSEFNGIRGNAADIYAYLLPPSEYPECHI